MFYIGNTNNFWAISGDSLFDSIIDTILKTHFNTNQDWFNLPHGVINLILDELKTELFHKIKLTESNELEKWPRYRFYEYEIRNFKQKVSIDRFGGVQAGIQTIDNLISIFDYALIENDSFRYYHLPKWVQEKYIGLAGIFITNDCIDKINFKENELDDLKSFNLIYINDNLVCETHKFKVLFHPLH